MKLQLGPFNRRSQVQPLEPDLTVRFLWCWEGFEEREGERGGPSGSPCASLPAQDLPSLPWLSLPRQHILPKLLNSGHLSRHVKNVTYLLQFPFLGFVSFIVHKGGALMLLGRSNFPHSRCGLNACQGTEREVPPGLCAAVSPWLSVANSAVTLTSLRGSSNHFPEGGLNS